MTITQTVDIPADRHVFFDFLAPREIPAGKTRVEVKLMPVVEKQDTALKNAKEGTSPHPNSDALFALFSQIRGKVDIDEIRTERLAKHIK
jgi:hypothetical protein